MKVSVHVLYVHPAHPSAHAELPRFGGNAQLGCGLVVREIKGHRYLYFWAYVGRSRGTHRKWTYIGPARKPETRLRARQLLMDYHMQVRGEIDRRMSALQAAGTGAR